jgi:hypothetical protein
MTGLLVYRAIHAVAAALAKAGIPKTHSNEDEGYEYRSIDDVLNRLAPLLAKHRLCVLPRVLQRAASVRRGDHGANLTMVELKVAFDFISADDGSRRTVKVYAEALDSGDKGTAKAMAAAFKTAMIQSLCIPVPGNDDADRLTPKLAKQDHNPEPVQGWPQWAADVIDTIGICETEEALVRVQDGKRAQLKAISRERNTLYVAIGEAFACRRTALAERGKVVLPEREPATKRSTRDRANVPELALA